jgi:hypothetical protein
MSGLLSFMTIGSGATSKPTGTSPSSRRGRIPSLHRCMLTGPICSRNVIMSSIGSLPRPRNLESLTCWVCIRIGTLSWQLSFAPWLGEVEMVMIRLSTSALKDTDIVFVSRRSPLCLDWTTMTFIGRRSSLGEQ